MREEQFSKGRQTQEQNKASSLKQNNSNMIPEFCFLVSQIVRVDRDQGWQTCATVVIVDINNQQYHFYFAV